MERFFLAREVVLTLVVFVLLVASAVAGVFLRARLPAPHRGQETFDFLRAVTALLVTFVALVMSLLLASELNSYSSAFRDRAHYASTLAELDACMRNYGAGLEEERRRLHGYTAAVIASTWPREPKPTGVDYPDPSKFPLVGEVPTLGGIMNAIGVAIAGLQPSDPLHANLARRCGEVFSTVMAARWSVIEDAHRALSTPFAGVLIFWLMLVFLSFGMQAPQNPPAAVIIVIAVVSVASVMFVLLDLDLPYGGLFGIPSTSMRLALSDMLR